MSLARPLPCLALAAIAGALACNAPPPPPADKPPAKVDLAAKPEQPPPPDTPPAPKIDPPKVDTPPSVPAGPAADAPVGVASCDEYVTRYRACIADLVPAITKEHHTKVLDAQRANWIAAGADPKLSPGLADECSAAFEATRAATRNFGCVWRPDDKPEPEIYAKGAPASKSRSRGVPDIDL